MNFWSGPMVIVYGASERVDLVGRVFIDLDYNLKIEVPNTLGFKALLLIEHKDIVIEIPELNDPVDVFLSSTATSETGDDFLIFTPRASPIWKPARSSLVRGRASLVNFTGFEKGAYAKSTLLLTASGWSIVITPVQKEILCYSPFWQNDEHEITHELDIERLNQASFSEKDLLDLFDKLALFFSFCHGGWIAIALAVGMIKDGTVGLAEWGIGHIGTPSTPDSFLDDRHLEHAIELFPLFMDKVADDDVADAFSHMIYWLRRSDVDNAGPDGGLILLQAALERIAWHLLVRQLGAISEKGFGDLAAADQIRLLLTNLHIPKQVPIELSELTKFAKANGLDGPEVFTRVRNRVVHPPKGRNRREESLPYYEAYLLGRWYGELSILALCGYKGKYSNRTKRVRWVGSVEPVPWV